MTLPNNVLRSENFFFVSVLIAIITLAVVDIVSDLKAGTTFSHVAMETTVALLAFGGVAYIVVTAWGLKRKVASEVLRREAAIAAAEGWKRESKKYIAGLATAIDQQLSAWSLTPAEKEVAFLLLKGLSIKEIAAICQKSDRTVRVQSAAIYEKSGLAGRSELAAFFLEDLLSARQGPGTEQAT